MREDARGKTLIDQDVVLTPDGVRGFEATLGTSSAGDTATLVPFFAAVIGGDTVAVDGLGLDLSRALLGGIDYTWLRPVEVGETVHARVVVDDVYVKGSNQFGVLGAEFTDRTGAVVQRQRITFIERAGR